MHLMIPFASSLDPHFEGALRELELPNLGRLLGLLAPVEDVGDADETAPLPRTNSFWRAAAASPTTPPSPRGACAQRARIPPAPPGRC
ncbi:hypothetical protein ACQ86G_00195 [Roseateles chitinivorans]|uniref:hypothetical protein n=1 Tax=Roseateles chitinivorans TaxID=2917965 RepID=UPI003D668ABB